jgi:hypothetical protein
MSHVSAIRDQTSRTWDKTEARLHFCSSFKDQPHLMDRRVCCVTQTQEKKRAVLIAVRKKRHETLTATARKIKAQETTRGTMAEQRLRTRRPVLTMSLFDRVSLVLLEFIHTDSKTLAADAAHNLVLFWSKIFPGSSSMWQGLALFLAFGALEEECINIFFQTVVVVNPTINWDSFLKITLQGLLRLSAAPK